MAIKRKIASFEEVQKKDSKISQKPQLAEKEAIYITTSRIYGIDAEPEYLEAQCVYLWHITFSNSSCPAYLFRHTCLYKTGNEEEESHVFCRQLKASFREAGIFEGDRVVVIFNEEGRVIAVGRRGEDKYVDVSDMFFVKTFKELNLSIPSLMVY